MSEIRTSDRTGASRVSKLANGVLLSGAKQGSSEPRSDGDAVSRETDCREVSL